MNLTGCPNWIQSSKTATMLTLENKLILLVTYCTLMKTLKGQIFDGN
jgi:hypothetical protein